MYAALYGDVESSRLLLDRGALVNARKDAGGTALMYAVDDVAKTNSCWSGAPIRTCARGKGARRC